MFNCDENINSRIESEKLLFTPKELKKKYPLSKNKQLQIATQRKEIKQIISRRDKRLLVVCGPCSIHDPNATKEYANRLKNLSEKLKDKLYIVMRVYFEKPRSALGWKGFVNDPNLDDSYEMQLGLESARKLLIELAELDLPLACEILEPNIHMYLLDLFSWAAIGARTVDSPIHRQLTSGLEIGVGFKNDINGNIEGALNATLVSSLPQQFITLNDEGQICLRKTKGNKFSHLILRGGKDKTNYDQNSILMIENRMKQMNINVPIMIDCSHGNSQKNYKNQKIVIESIIEQLKQNNNSIFGLMIESFLNEGAQPLVLPKEKMKYGVSITDECIGWNETEFWLTKLANSLK